jgi:hypothetical protein
MEALLLLVEEEIEFGFELAFIAALPLHQGPD